MAVARDGGIEAGSDQKAVIERLGGSMIAEMRDRYPFTGTDAYFVLGVF
jgi:hypothetical protein